MTVVRHQLFPQKPPGSRFRFSRTGVQPSRGSSTIDLPSAFAESGAYPPDRELPGSPRQCSLPLARRHPPEGHRIGARKRRTPENTILSQPYCRRVATDRPNREGSQLAASLEGEPGPTPAGKTLPHSYPETSMGAYLLLTLTDIRYFLCFSGQRGTIALFYLSLCIRSICMS